jgi:hypothetical protein
MTPPPLSPAAQAVLDAWSEVTGWGGNPPPVELSALAAAIRALVEATLPEEERFRGGMRPGGTQPVTPDEFRQAQRRHTRAQQLAIAAELHGGNTPTETSNEPVTQPILWNGQTDRTCFPCIKVIEISEILDGNTTTETPND